MKIHIVKKGDTMYMIAKKYNVSLEDLIKANPEIANPDIIDVGMKVKVPTSPQPTYELIHQHKVQQGDTLWKLSKAWGIPLADMIKANPQLKNPNVLLTGEIVNIPKVPASGETGVAPASGQTGKKPTGKKPTGVKPDTGVIEPAAAAPLPEPLPILPEPPPMPLPEPLPVKPVKPEMEKPKAVEPLQKPAEKPKLVEPLQKPMEKPKMAEPLQKPLEKLDMKEPYPVETQFEQDLFAQFPIPAVEAGALMPEYPNLPANVQMPFFGAETTKDLTLPSQNYGHHLSKDLSQHFPYPGAESTTGKMFDWSGATGHDTMYGYGDMFNAGAYNWITPANTQVQDFSIFMPSNLPAYSSPQMMSKPTAGCTTCGGTSTAPAMQAMNQPYVGQMAQSQPNAGYPGIDMMPTNVSPAAANMYPNIAYPETGFMPTNIAPAMAYPNMSYPGKDMTPTNVSPAAANMYPNIAYPETGFMPTNIAPVMAYPNMSYPGKDMMPTNVSPAAANMMPSNVSPAADVFPNMAYPATANIMPTNVSPAAANIYPNMAYPETGFMPTNIAPAMAYPNMGYPGKDMMPTYVSPAEDFHHGKHMTPHYMTDPLYIPPIPQLPPLREDDGGDPNSLSLHAAEEEAPDAPAIAKKRQAAAKKKSSARRPKRKSKESLPWIK